MLENLQLSVCENRDEYRMQQGGPAGEGGGVDGTYVCDVVDICVGYMCGCAGRWVCVVGVCVWPLCDKPARVVSIEARKKSSLLAAECIKLPSHNFHSNKFQSPMKHILQCERKEISLIYKRNK